MVNFLYGFLLIILLNLCNSLYAQNSIIDLLSLKKPKLETCQEQTKILKKWDVSTNNVFQFSDNFIDSMGGSINYTLDTHMMRWNEYSPIQFRVYNNSGDFITGWQYCFGSLKKLEILSVSNTIKDITRLPINRNLNLVSDKNLISSLSCNNNIESINFKNYDYIIVAFWASYYGRASRKMLQSIENFCEQSKNLNVLFIKVNYNGN